MENPIVLSLSNRVVVGVFCQAFSAGIGRIKTMEPNPYQSLQGPPDRNQFSQPYLLGVLVFCVFIGFMLVAIVIIRTILDR